MPRIKVAHANGVYEITVGCGISNKLTLYLRRRCQQNRLFVVFDANFYALHGRKLTGRSGAFAKASVLVIPSGEKTKSATELTRLYNYFLGQKISRSDLIVAIGGGVTSDLVGYAAATTLRGISWGVVSTTLLGMVDAAIGGKTGINHTGGKNLVGAFWQPSFVWADTQFLNTLPRRELVSGLGELLKYAGLIGPSMTARLASYLNKELLIDDTKIQKLIVDAARYKGEVVAADEREAGQRMILNLGHTFAHAIENVLGYGRLRHGEAVILGLLAAVELSILEKPSRERTLDEYHSLIKQGIGLVPKKKLSAEAVIGAMSLDKKRIRQKQHFILLDRPGKPIIVDTPSPANVRKSVTAMLDYYMRHGGRNA